MFSRGEATVDEQIRSIEGEKAKIHIELAALYQRREIERQNETRGWHQVEAAQANQLKINGDIEKFLEQIVVLQHQIADLIPQQRTGD